MIARTFFSRKWNDNGEPWFQVDLPFKCDIYMNYIDHETLAKTPSGVKKVFMDINEPTFYGQSVETLLENADKFNAIITKHQSVINSIPWATTDIWASSYIIPNKNIDKDFSVSFLCTNKKGYPGYEVRHQLWNRQDEITVPKRFWSSKYLPVDPNRILPGTGENTDKIVLFKSMFSICPENSSEENYLTEKIMDCFLTMTVPIYRGCTNFEKYFNPNGVIFFNDIDDLIQKINNLTPYEYFSRLPAMQENFNKAMKMMNPGERVRDLILQKIKQ